MILFSRSSCVGSVASLSSIALIDLLSTLIQPVTVVYGSLLGRILQLSCTGWTPFKSSYQNRELKLGYVFGLLHKMNLLMPILIFQDE